MNELVQVGLKAVFGAILTGLALNYFRFDYLLAWATVGGLVTAVLLEPRRTLRALCEGFVAARSTWRARQSELKNCPSWAKAYVRWEGLCGADTPFLLMGFAGLLGFIFTLGSPSLGGRAGWPFFWWPLDFGFWYFVAAALLSGCFIGGSLVTIRPAWVYTHAAKEHNEAECRERVRKAKRFILVWNGVVAPFSLIYYVIKDCVLAAPYVGIFAITAWNYACSNIFLAGLVGGSMGGAAGFMADKNVIVFAAVSALVCTSLVYLGRRAQARRVR